jgi:hypothetical protein
MLYTVGRETESVAEWAKAIGPLVQEAGDFPVEGFGRFVAAWSKAVSYVGESELYARKAERYEVFGVEEAVAQAARARFERLNDVGAEGLERARRDLDALQDGFAQLDRELEGSGRDLRQELDEHRLLTLESLADAEMKRSDAEQLRELIDDAYETATSRGLAGLGGWMAGKLDEGVKARRSPDRGAETNFPWWKLVAVIALLIALGIAFAIHCGVFGCGVTSRDAYITAILMVASLFWC